MSVTQKQIDAMSQDKPRPQKITVYLHEVTTSQVEHFADLFYQQLPSGVGHEIDIDEDSSEV